ncbi:MAG TPA: site-specific integrase [Streptosporangiaceae bacterium]|nr:site-specific integrase [Streptosporangiaceae bacterium]
MGARCPLRGEEGHGSWYLSLELPAAPDGRRRRIRRGGFPSRDSAETALARLQMPSPGDPGSPPLTVGQWLERWLVRRAAPRNSTLRGYAAHVRLYLAPCLGQILLADLSPAHVQAMFTAITRQHEAMGRPVTTATLVRVKATLRTALNGAIRAGHITTNAASRAELPPARRPKAVVWTAERISEWQRTGIRPSVAVWTPAQTAAFLNAIQGHRLYAAYHLIALRGLRRGEAAGLRWCDIDLDTGTAFISWQLQQYDGHVALCPPKTAHSERIIALDRTTVAALHAHRARQLAERAAADEDYLDSGYVFTRLNGDPMAPDWLSRYFRRLNDASGLPPIRLHDLRHGAASLALAAGADLKVVQDMLGHSSIVLTADTYTSVLPEVAHKVAEDIASLIIAAGCLIPGSQERRRPAWRTLGQRAHTLLTAGLSHAHPARQISRPHRQLPASLTQRGTQTVLPSVTENGPTARAAIPWPTSAHTASASSA